MKKKTPFQKLIVTSVVPSRSNPYKYIQFPFEVEAESFNAVFERLAEDGCLCGWRAMVSDSPDGEKVATERIPTIVSIAGFAFIAPCHFDYRSIDEVGVNE